MGKPLPPELLLCIFEYARRMRAIGALASAPRASHTFNALVTPLLYRTLVITSQNYAALRRARSLTAFHDRAQLVHDLIIDPDVRLKAPNIWRREEELEDMLPLFSNATTFASECLSFCPPISSEVTSLSTTHVRIAWSLLRPVTAHLVHLQFTRVIRMVPESYLYCLNEDELSSLPRLRTISLHFEHPARCEWSDEYSSEEFVNRSTVELDAFVRTLLRISTLKRLLVLAPAWERGAPDIPDKVQRVYEWKWLQDFRDPRVHFALLPSALADVPFGPWVEGILGPTPLEEWGEQVWQDASRG